jgi:NADP-dependent 3-hydroxy acid dehydrogenase YdfG
MDLQKLNKKYPEKRAIITGANSGVGFEILKILLQNQWKVLALDIHANQLKELNTLPETLFIQLVDITDRSLFQQSITSFCEKQNGVDILFNNAGVGEGVRFKDYSLENWDWIIDINLKSVIAGSYHVLNYMQKQSKGLIVNMASAAGYANLPNMSPYNVTKASVISLSETLAHEFSRYGIQVKCITPTFFQSNILKNSKGTQDVLQSANRIINGAKMNSYDAALHILSTLHKKEENLKFPFSAKAIFFSKTLFPKLYRHVIRKFLVK